ncbi:hypothetical protein BH23ACT5_BH23ACT5_02360 [soil metagenome]
MQPLGATPGLTVLGGKPKIGKSWLMYGLAADVAAGTPALGAHATQGDPALYIALEDSERRMQDRAKALDIDTKAHRRLSVATEWATMGEGGLDELDYYLRITPACRLVMIDTWQRFRGDAGNGKDRYAEDYKVGAQLQDLAKRHEVALLLAHHLRKLEADDWIDRMSGSAGITGAADTVWDLFRERGQHDATLRITGRDVFEIDVALRQDGARWKSLGNADAWRTTEERRPSGRPCGCGRHDRDASWSGVSWSITRSSIWTTKPTSGGVASPQSESPHTSHSIWHASANFATAGPTSTMHRTMSAAVSSGGGPSAHRADLAPSRRPMIECVWPPAGTCSIGWAAPGPRAGDHHLRDGRPRDCPPRGRIRPFLSRERSPAWPAGCRRRPSGVPRLRVAGRRFRVLGRARRVEPHRHRGGLDRPGHDALEFYADLVEPVNGAQAS